MPYFTYTKLNLYLDLLLVIGFQHFIALWKAYNNSNQIAQFCKEFLHRFLQRCILREFAHFQLFLNTHVGFKNFENVFVDLNLLGQGIFKNV